VYEFKSNQIKSNNKQNVKNVKSLYFIMLKTRIKYNKDYAHLGLIDSTDGIICTFLSHREAIFSAQERKQAGSDVGRAWSASLFEAVRRERPY